MLKGDSRSMMNNPLRLLKVGNAMGMKEKNVRSEDDVSRGWAYAHLRLRSFQDHE